MNTTRSRWAAIGAAIAVTLGAGGIGITHATTDSSEGPVAAFFPIEPCRLADNAAITEDSSITLNGWGATGDCTLPNDISGLVANVTAVNATAQTNLRFYAQGDAVPGTANLNPSPGASPTPNAVTIPLNDANGQFQVYNRFGSVGVFIDIMGYYDDHTHDDRYYTEDEVDDALATKDNAEGAVAFIDDESIALNATDTVILSATVDTPTSGYIMADASIRFVGANATNSIRCSLSTTDQLDLTSVMIEEAPADFDTISLTRGFVENKAILVIGGDDNELTVNVVCDERTGSVTVSEGALTLTFVPDPDAFGFIFVPFGESDGPSNDGS